MNGGPTSPNSGTVTAIGSLGFDTESKGRVRHRGIGTAFAALGGADPYSPSLYSIDLTTGAASLVGPIGFGADGIIGLAVQSIPEPGSAALLGIAGLPLGLRCRR